MSEIEYPNALEPKLVLPILLKSVETVLATEKENFRFYHAYTCLCIHTLLFKELSYQTIDSVTYADTLKKGFTYIGKYQNEFTKELNLRLKGLAGEYEVFVADNDPCFINCYVMQYSAQIGRELDTEYQDELRYSVRIEWLNRVIASLKQDIGNLQ